MRMPIGGLHAQLVGSYTKPDWLIAHKRVTSPAADFWRPHPDVLASAQDDATRLAVADQERAGLDLITDGELRRQRFDTYFFHLGGIDHKRLGRWSMERRDHSFVELDPAVEARLAEARVPRVVGEVSWPGPIALEDLRFLKAQTERPVKMTVIGPLTAAARLANEAYPSEEALGMALAAVINEELRALDAEGVDVVQIDEPDFHFRHDAAVAWGAAAIDRAFEGIEATKAVHVCYGYATIGRKHLDEDYGRVLEAIAASSADAISLEYEQPGHDARLLTACGDKAVILGLLDLSSHAAETVERIADRAREALEVVPEERLSLAPDCGMWFLPREIAYGKIAALGSASRRLRAERGLG